MAELRGWRQPRAVHTREVAPKGDADAIAKLDQRITHMEGLLRALGAEAERLTVIEDCMRNLGRAL